MVGSNAHLLLESMLSRRDCEGWSSGVAVRGGSELVSARGELVSPPRPSGGMADAVDSKSTEGNLVRVRLSPRASSAYRTGW